jgi:type I restriction enzyme R subunit
MPTEADTCRTHITPALQAAGWESSRRSIAEQRFFTDGRIVVRGNTATRRQGKRAYYILRYTRDFPIAVVEAKAEDKPAADGLQQAKDYAEILNLIIMAKADTCQHHYACLDHGHIPNIRGPR